MNLIRNKPDSRSVSLELQQLLPDFDKITLLFIKVVKK